MEIQSIEAAKQFDENRFTKIDMIKTGRSVAFLLNFLPGQHMKPHDHPNRELYLYVTEGEGTLHINEKDMEIKQGDVLLCEAEEKIGFTNTSDNCVSIYCTMTKLSE